MGCGLDRHDMIHAHSISFRRIRNPLRFSTVKQSSIMGRCSQPPMREHILANLSRPYVWPLSYARCLVCGCLGKVGDCYHKYCNVKYSPTSCGRRGLNDVSPVLCWRENRRFHTGINTSEASIPRVIDSVKHDMNTKLQQCTGYAKPTPVSQRPRKRCRTLS